MRRPIACLRLAVGFSLIFSAPPPVASGDRPRPPNVIVIVVDTLRADYLNCYGFKPVTSPTIDRLASSGVLFERCASAASWTKPSVTSLMTSLHVESHGQIDGLRRKYGNGGGAGQTLSKLPGEASMIAEVFSDAGYGTAAFIANRWITRKFGFGQGFDVFQFNHNRDVLMDAGKWLKTRKADRPFFLYLQPMDVHAPYKFNEEDFARIRDELDPAGKGRLSRRKTEKFMGHTRATFTKNNAEANRAPGASQAPSAAFKRPRGNAPSTFRKDPKRMRSVNNWRAAYAAGVKRFDGMLDGFLKTVEKVDRSRNTIIVLTADHGEGLFEHGRIDHGMTLHIEELHVPLIVRLPNEARAGTRVQGWVSLVDVLPTLADLCGIERSPVWQGVSLKEFLETARAVTGRTIFSRTPGVGVSALQDNLHLIRSRERVQLFDVEKDPLETNDLADDREAEVACLRAEVKAHAARQRGRELPASETVVSEELQEELRSLGYLQ